jgi:ankyrin repeat protein
LTIPKISERFDHEESSMPKKKSRKAASTPLEAVESGDLDALRALLKAGADVNESEEETALSKAAEVGRADLVKLLLEAGADPDFGGLSVPICQGVGSGNIEVVKLLIQAKAKVDARDEDGVTALMIAAAAGDLPMVRLLVAAGANPKLRDEEGESAIIKARESPTVVEFLIPLSTKKDIAAVAKAARIVPDKTKDLVQAARLGDARQVKRLLAEGTPMNGTDDEGETALYAAVEGGHAEIVDILLDKGAKVDSKNRYGRTPLLEAAHSGRMALAERLLAAGADVNVRDKLEGKTPFLACIRREEEHREMMRLLARHGADLNATDDYGRTAFSLAERYLGRDSDDEEERRDKEALREVFVKLGLLHPDANAFTNAAGTGDLAMVRSFIESGVPVDAVDEQERTALYMAVSRQHPDVVAELLKGKADVHKAIGRDEGEDVQWGGVARPCPHCATVFVSIERGRHCPRCRRQFDAHEVFGSNINDQPMFVSWSNSFVPLMAAAKVGNVVIARMLIDAGAAVNHGKDGVTPLMTACYYDHLEAAKLLIERGTDVRKETKTPDRVQEKISAAIIAGKRRNIAMIKLLWDAGAPAKDKKATLLVDAARHGDVRQIDDLLAQGASPAAEDPLSQEEPLAAAASAGKADAVRRLIAAGAPVNPVSARQVSALMLLANGVVERSKRGKIAPSDVDDYVAAAKCLVDAGAKVDVSFFGFKPIDSAKHASCRPLIDLLQTATRREQETMKRR